METLLSFW